MHFRERAVLFTPSTRSFIYSFYSFEYVWSMQGIDFVARINRLEAKWPYYLGFGVPVTLAAFFGTRYVNAAAYAIVFPFVSRTRACSAGHADLSSFASFYRRVCCLRCYVQMITIKSSARCQACPCLGEQHNCRRAVHVVPGYML